MAAEFLKAGDSVVVCGRDSRRLAGALAALQQVADSSPARPRVSGLVCDVSKAAEVDALQGFVAQAFAGRPVDIWLNNAGQVTPRRVLADIEPGVLESVVGVNVLGSLLCCRAAIALAQQQRRQQQAAGGQPTQQRTTHIYNFGFSWGAGATKSACTHKATKAALAQLNSALNDDLREAGIDYVQVHNLSPGMVLTDLLLANAPLAARRIFNVLADEPEDVAAAVVPRIRAAAASNARGSAGDVSHLSPASAAGRMLRGLPQVISGSGRFFTAAGERAQPGRFNAAGVRLLHDAQE